MIARQTVEKRPNGEVRSIFEFHVLFCVLEISHFFYSPSQILNSLETNFLILHLFTSNPRHVASGWWSLYHFHYKFCRYRCCFTFLLLLLFRCLFSLVNRFLSFAAAKYKNILGFSQNTHKIQQKHWNCVDDIGQRCRWWRRQWRRRRASQFSATQCEYVCMNMMSTVSIYRIYECTFVYTPYERAERYLLTNIHSTIPTVLASYNVYIQPTFSKSSIISLETNSNEIYKKNSQQELLLSATVCLFPVCIIFIVTRR